LGSYFALVLAALCKVVCGPCSFALAFQTNIVIDIAKWDFSSCVQLLRLVPIAVIIQQLGLAIT
jgi:hypothetical protein